MITTAGIELARDRLRKSAFHRSVINAEMFDPQGALGAGFLDKVVAPEELHAAALEAARQLKKINMNAHNSPLRADVAYVCSATGHQPRLWP